MSFGAGVCYQCRDTGVPARPSAPDCLRSLRHADRAPPEFTDSFAPRDFLAATAGTLAAGALSGRAAASPNEAITLGFIGVGGMGTGLLNIFKGFDDVRVAAVCDVYEPHALRAKERPAASRTSCGDFRRVLDRKDIDAVVIATPDHWHAIPTILACQAGKDVYCEKPLAYRIGEGRRVVDAATKHRRVTQMGNLIHATDNYHRIAEIVQSGGLGTVRKARVLDGPLGRRRPRPPRRHRPAGRLRLRLLARPRPRSALQPEPLHLQLALLLGLRRRACSATSSATCSTRSTGA